MKYFIEKGFDWTIQDNNGFAYLHYGWITLTEHFFLLIQFFIALTRGHPDVVIYFIEKGYDWNIQNNNGCTTHHYG